MKIKSRLKRKSEERREKKGREEKEGDTERDVQRGMTKPLAEENTYVRKKTPRVHTAKQRHGDGPLKAVQLCPSLLHPFLASITRTICKNLKKKNSSKIKCEQRQ